MDDQSIRYIPIRIIQQSNAFKEKMNLEMDKESKKNQKKISTSNASLSMIWWETNVFLKEKR